MAEKTVESAPLDDEAAILDWVFGSRSKQVRHTACCDSCDAERIKKHGRLQYIGTNVS